MKHQQVVVGFDFSKTSDAVIERAVTLANRAPSHILHFVTVIDPHSGIAAVPKEKTVDYRYADRVREAMLERVRNAFGASELPEQIQFFAHARIGKPAHEILELATEVGADLILVGTHGTTGLTHLMMGSTAERVVRDAGCPVLVVRPKRYGDIELEKMTELEGHVPHQYRGYRISYTNNQVVLRPPDWTILP